MNKTLLRKLMMAFLIGFVPIFVGGLSNALEAIAGGEDWSLLGTALASLASGAVAAGIRAAFAVWTNFVPGDEIHGHGPPDAAVVTTKGSTPATRHDVAASMGKVK